MAFDFSPLFAAGLPAPVVKWTGAPKFNFTGGNNDPDELPLEGLMAAAQSVLVREGTLEERPVTIGEVRDAEELALVSSVRGWRPAVLVP